MVKKKIKKRIKRDDGTRIKKKKVMRKNKKPELVELDAVAKKEVTRIVGLKKKPKTMASQLSAFLTERAKHPIGVYYFPGIEKVAKDGLPWIRTVITDGVKHPTIVTITFSDSLLTNASTLNLAISALVAEHTSRY